MDTASHKVCTACGLDKAASEYYRDRRAPHGLCTQCRHCMNERKKALRQNSLEKTRSKWRADYAANKPRYIKHARAFVDRHPDLVRLWRKNNHHKRRDKKSTLTSKDFVNWVNSQEMLCHWCGADCKSCYHIDHVMPFHLGGKHELSNMVISCPHCNFRKGYKDPERWLNELAKS